MRKYTIMLLTMVILLSGCAKKEPIKDIEGENKTPNDTTGVINISAEKAKEIIDTEEDEIVLDVRTEEEYNEGHIKGAVLLPDNEIKEKVEAVIPDKSKSVLVYCRSGRRSAAAAKELIDMGYTNVFDFGGIMDWNYEIVKIQD